ncbi:MAG: acetyl-CoA carboxylase biotin carboxyl carrier protein subunit [Anaerolineaceae bacterium]|nr:acetyl-CoA carboxylase biotin carboxyl carrier protein subunit [Anaerolineaceae bacterium]
MYLTVNVKNKSYQVEINDINARPIKAIIDGEVFEVTPEINKPSVQQIQKPKAVSTSKPAPASSVTSGMNNITAPIPGVITTIKVSVGDTLSVGEEVCTLEAMKMNNVIRSTKTGIVSSININQGDHVQHGQILIELAG